MTTMPSEAFLPDRLRETTGGDRFEKQLDGATRIAQLGNGVSVNVRRVAGDGSVMIMLRLGAGLSGCDPAKLSPRWAIDSGALLFGGTRDLPFADVQHIAQSSGLALFTALGDGYLAISGIGRATELTTYLGVLAGYAERPAFRRELVQPTKLQYGRQVFPRFKTTSMGPMEQYLQQLMHGGDLRWRTPDLDDIRWATEDEILSDLEKLMVTNYIDVTIVGDVDPTEAVEAARRQFSCVDLPLGKLSDVSISPTSFSLAGSPGVVVDVHDPAQEASLAAWPVSDFYSDRERARRQEMLQIILQRKLIYRLDEPAFGKFEASLITKDFGYLMVGAQLPESRAPDFRSALEDACSSISSGAITDEQVGIVRETLLERERRAENSLAEAALRIMDWSRRPERIETQESVEASLMGIQRDQIVEMAPTTLDPAKCLSVQFRVPLVLEWGMSGA